MSFIFNADETAQQREERKNKAVMNALYGGATQAPQNMGQGMASMGHALAYRAAQNRQAEAQTDPWSGMRQPTQGGMFGPIKLGLMGLFSGR